MDKLLVSIPEDEFEGIQEACDSGQINPYDYFSIVDWLLDNNCIESAKWITRHEEDYFRGITFGFRVYEDMSAEALTEGVEVYIVIII